MDRADLLEAGERRLHRDRASGRVVDDLAEHVLHLVLAARGLRDPEGEDGEDERRQAEQEERPAPALVAAGQRGDAADERPG